MQILESDCLGSNPASATCTRFPHLLGAVPTSTPTLIRHVIELQKPFGMCVCFHSFFCVCVCVCVFILVISLTYWICGFLVLDEPAVTEK